MATIVYLIQTMIYVGMVVYAPSLALESVKNGVLPVVDNIETGKNAKPGKSLGTDYYDR